MPEDTDIARLPEHPKDEHPPDDGSREVDINGYRGETRDIDGYPLLKEGTPYLPDRNLPWTFKREDFASEDDYWQALECYRSHAAFAPRQKPRAPDLKRVRPSGESGEQRQVGLRLPGEDYERLVERARSYGLRPATLARMLVVRAMREE